MEISLTYLGTMTRQQTKTKLAPHLEPADVVQVLQGIAGEWSLVAVIRELETCVGSEPGTQALALQTAK